MAPPGPVLKHLGKINAANAWRISVTEAAAMGGSVRGATAALSALAVTVILLLNTDSHSPSPQAISGRAPFLRNWF